MSRPFKLGEKTIALHDAAREYARSSKATEPHASIALAGAARSFADAFERHRKLQPKRTPPGKCSVCGRAIENAPTGRPRKYCSEDCYQLKRAHPAVVKPSHPRAGKGK